MADVPILRAIQDYSLIFPGAALLAPYSSLEVGPFGHAGGAAGGVRIGVHGAAPGATDGFMNGPSLPRDAV